MKALMLAVALAAAACSPQTESEAPAAATQAAAPAASALNGAGTVTAIDVAAGTITLEHDPIAALNWPAMTMPFTVEDPALLQGVAVGDRVSFTLKSEAESQTIVAMTKR